VTIAPLTSYVTGRTGKMIQNNITLKEEVKLNSEQRQAVEAPLESSVKIVAGAGTGKTEIISRRFVKLVQDLIQNGVRKPAGRILVITFTDKAAGNMKDRILKRLSEYGIDTGNTELWISTFHSFCNNILKRHSLEVKLSSDCKLATEEELKEVYEDIKKRILHNETNTISYLQEICNDLSLNDDILCTAEILKLNKAGNPAELLDEIYHIIKKIKSLGITPAEFLQQAEPPTVKFGKTVKELPCNYTNIDDCAFDWDRHLSQYKEDGFTLDKDIIDKKIRQSKVIIEKSGRGNSAVIGYAAGFPENVDKITEVEVYLTRVIACIYAIYQKTLLEKDIIDFDDMINKSIEILINNDDLRKYYQKLFKHIIIDEFQDTSGSQLRLVKLLLSPDKPNITFVGDKKQSIYGFRHAQMENLDLLHTYIETTYKTKYEPVKLSCNYRSTPYVLKPVNKLTRQYMELDEELNPNLHKNFDPDDTNVQITKLTGSKNSDEAKINEAKYIAGEIQRLKDRDNADFKDFAVLIRSHSRGNIIEKYLLDAGIPCVKKQNNGYFYEPEVKNLIAMVRLVENLRDEVAFVRLLEIKYSDAQLYRLVKAMNSKLQDFRDEFQFRELNFVDKILILKEKDQLQSLDIQVRLLKDIEKIINVVTELSRNQDEINLLQIFRTLINSLDAYYNLTDYEKAKADQNIKIFEKLIINYMQEDDFITVRGFLDALEIYKSDNYFELPAIVNEEIDAVQILTLHACKGLEFPYVFVTADKFGVKTETSPIIFDLQYGDKPGFGIIISKYKGKDNPKRVIHKHIWEYPRQYKENIRLFYVAISRAEEYLNIINFDNENKRGKAPEYGNESLLPSQVIDVDVNDIQYTRTERQISITREIKQAVEIKPVPVFIPGELDHLKLTFTALNSFNKCPRFYMLKYANGFPEESNGHQNGTNVGSIVHNLIFRSYINNKNFTDGDLNKHLCNLSLQDDNIQRIKGLYTGFCNSAYCVNGNGKLAILEKPFSFTEKINNVDIEFSGNIDLIVKNGSRDVTVIDFKTNKTIEDSLEDYHKQLLIYVKALRSEGLDVSRAGIVHLMDKEHAAYIATDDELEKAELALYSDIQNIIGQLKADNLSDGKKGKSCYFCGYGYLCKANH
jgi:superfamily I DNA/RNA helicase/CRISPR/Cas system-associated exonuclease Cas4 (RecB family)